MEREKNIIKMVKYRLKGNIYMAKEMEKERNIIVMVILNMMENIIME